MGAGMNGINKNSQGAASLGRRCSRRRFVKLLAGMAVAGAGGYAV